MLFSALAESYFSTPHGGSRNTEEVKVELSIAFIPLPFIAETVLALTPVEGRCVTANQDLRQTFREATHEIPGHSCIDLSPPTFC